jgi:peptidoglycan-N-acetylglucosamine deacetylase
MTCLDPAHSQGTPGRVLWRLPSGIGPSQDNAGRIALTFDDGPHPETTPRLLRILAEHDAHATFFLVGSRAAEMPDLVDRIAAEGHLIGSHGWDHCVGWWRGSKSIGVDLNRAESVLGRHLNPKVYRPPYGALTPSRYLTARNRGYTIGMWSRMAYDWKDHDADAIERQLKRIAVPRRIVLLHECNAVTGAGYHHTVEAVERWLEYANYVGYECVSLKDACETS